jgi:hypothetical protein
MAVMRTYLCLMESDGNCITETLPETLGEEQCRVLRPWIRGMVACVVVNTIYFPGHHLYSWFFTLDTRVERLNEWKSTNATRYPNGTVVYDQMEPVATLMMLGVNRCFDAC